MKLLSLANPVTVTRGVVGLAGSAVGLADTVVRGSAHLALSGLHRAGAALADPPTAGTDFAEDPAADAPAEARDEPVPPGPTTVVDEPHAPDQPPVDVVGAALAAEAERGDRAVPEGAGLAHEPRAASRDEEHGDAALTRATVDDIAEEATAALEGDVGPEEHLTEPLLSPADAKAIAAETATLRKAADPRPGGGPRRSGGRSTRKTTKT